jgi:serine protease AprX
MDSGQVPHGGITVKRNLLILGLIGCTTLGFAKSKLSSELKGRGHDTSSVKVIVQFKHKPGASHQSEISGRGGSVQGDLSLVNSLQATMPASKLEELSNDDEVAYISPDRPLGNSLNNSTGAVLANYAWGLGLDGTGVGVAVIDSGIHVVADLNGNSGKGSRVVASFDTIGGGPDDQYGHGTHVAGIIAGNAAASSCKDCTLALRGMAPNVTLINFHALDQNGQGTDSSVISAINQAIALKSKYNIRVINLSLGRPVFESYTQDPLCQAVEAAWKAGIVVVVAAGNDGRDDTMGTSGYGTISAPGNDPYVITVGAMNTVGTPDRADDVMTTYSSKGPTAIDHIAKPDIMAPGNHVISLQANGTLAKAYPDNKPLLSYYNRVAKANQTSPAYFTLSGTSMATPVVSAAAALLIQQNPMMTPDQVKARLMTTAFKNLPSYTTVTDSGTTFTMQSDIFTVGAGYLDMQAALSDISLANLSAKSPATTYDEVTGNVYFVADSSAIWGSSAMWGSFRVWGKDAFTADQSSLGGSSALWGSSAMWGSFRTKGFSALWGSSAMWGSFRAKTMNASSVSIQGDK